MADFGVWFQVISSVISTSWRFDFTQESRNRPLWPGFPGPAIPPAREVAPLPFRCPSARFAGMLLHRHQCEPFFGPFRREALVGSGLHGPVPRGRPCAARRDGLRGRCVALPEPLLLHRDHADRYTRAVMLGDPEEVGRWWDTSRPAGRFRSSLHFFVRYGHYWGVVRKTVGDRRERWTCYGHLVRWWFAATIFGRRRRPCSALFTRGCSPARSRSSGPCSASGRGRLPGAPSWSTIRTMLRLRSGRLRDSASSVAVPARSRRSFG